MKLGNLLLVIALLAAIAYLYMNKEKKEEKTEKTVVATEQVVAAKTGDATTEQPEEPSSEEDVATERNESGIDEEKQKQEEERLASEKAEQEKIAAEKAEKEKQEKLAAIMAEKEAYEKYMATLKKIKWPKTDVKMQTYSPLINDVPENNKKLKDLASIYVFYVAACEKQKKLAEYALKQLDEDVSESILSQVSVPCQYCKNTGKRTCRDCKGSAKCVKCNGAGQRKTTKVVPGEERRVYSNHGKYSDGGRRYYIKRGQNKIVDAMEPCSVCGGSGRCNSCEDGKTPCDANHDKYASIDKNKCIPKIAPARKSLYSCVAKKLKSFDDVVPSDDGDKNDETAD